MPTNTDSQDLDEWTLAIVDGPAAAFATVRQACASAGFNEPGVCKRFDIERMVHFKSAREGRAEIERHGDALEALSDLFLDLRDVDTAYAVQLLGDDTVSALRDLGLVRTSPRDTNAIAATMLMYPAAGVVLVSDRTYGRPGEFRVLPPDIVYPSVTRSSDTFMRMQLPSRCDAFLEMCAGNGIAAIAMASRATHSWSLDITERATRVAQFNAHLNGLDNVSALQGDLYEPVRDLTFDRIVAHPPYVPSFESRFIYRDGGVDGEHITRRIIAELPTYLRPGGRFYCTCVVTDRTDAPFERRLREWLGPTADEYDIVVSVTSADHPSEHYFKSAINGAITVAAAEQRHLAFKEMGVEAMLFTSFVIERHTSRRAPATIRIKRSQRTSGRELEQLCNWLTAREDPMLLQRMLGAYPKIDSGAKLRQTNELAGDKWKAADTEFECSWPFVVSLHCPNEVAQLLARCDGTRTLKQIIAWLRQKGLLNASAPDRAVLDTVANCVAAGAVFLEERV